MAKTRGAHSLRPRVRQGPTPLTVGPSTAGPYAAVGPSTAASPSTAAAGANPRVPAVRPSVAAASSAPSAVQSPAAGDAEGSSYVAPAHRRYHTWVGPTPPAPSHPRPARGAHLPRGPELQAQESHPLRDPGHHPLHLIRVLPEPQIYLLHPSSGDLTSPATPSQGMLAAGGEISMERFTTTSRH